MRYSYWKENPFYWLVYTYNVAIAISSHTISMCVRKYSARKHVVDYGAKNSMLMSKL